MNNLTSLTGSGYLDELTGFKPPIISIILLLIVLILASVSGYLPASNTQTQSNISFEIPNATISNCKAQESNGLATGMLLGWFLFGGSGR